MLLKNFVNLGFKTEESFRLTLYWWVAISASNSLWVKLRKVLTGAANRRATNGMA
jgi:hypothetical protein